MSADNLCRPIDPFHQQAPGFVKFYPEENYKLSIRPLCVTTDMEIVYGWLEQQMGIQSWKDDSPKPELLQSYIDILESTFSQSLLCLLDDQPVCQIDISQTPYNEVFMYLDVGKGDYALWLIMSCHVTIHNAYVNIVKACLEYFFSFGDVERVITYLPTYDEWANHLLMNAGFTYLDTKQMLTGVVNIYEYRKKRKNK
jgi:hypothetical protein